MLPTTVRRFDLYDIFSIFVPGALVVIGFLPFLPEKTTLGAGAAGATVVLGLTVGRGIHTATIWAQEVLDTPTHRDRFYQELQSPEHTSDSLVSAFLDAVEERYDGIAVDRERTDSGERVLASADGGSAEPPLYTLVRSYVHMDSRGRSRTFQAIHALHRSMLLATSILTFSYFTYGSLSVTGVLTNLAGYTSYVGALEIPSALLVLLPPLFGSVAFAVSRHGMRLHRQYYVQYLVSDFLTLHEAEDAIEDGDPTVRRPYTAR